MLDLIKQTEQTFEPYRAISTELSDIDIPGKVLRRYHAAFFACANLQLSLKIMQNFFFENAICCQYWNKYSLLFFHQNQEIENLSLLIYSYKKNIKLFSEVSRFCTSEKNFVLLEFLFIHQFNSILICFDLH